MKIGVSAPSGGGKTLGALLIAYGLMKAQYPNLSDSKIWEKIAIIDTENGSGELYCGSEVGGVKIGEYNAVSLEAPFEADKYTSAIDLCEDNKIEVCIIDSSTHLWSGAGGLLEQQGTAAKRSGNSYTAWREITPQHNRFVERMLQCNMHVIATMRAKQEYVTEKGDNGKTTVRKMGLEPEQRKGMEYEFTLFLEVNSEHEAFGAKDRTSIFDQKTFKITPKVGQQLMDWLQTGITTEHVVVATQHVADKPVALETVRKEIVELCKELGGQANDDLMKIVKKFAPGGNPNSIKDETKVSELRSELIEFKEKTNKSTKETV